MFFPSALYLWIAYIYTYIHTHMCIYIYTFIHAYINKYKYIYIIKNQSPSVSFRRMFWFILTVLSGCNGNVWPSLPHFFLDVKDNIITLGSFHPCPSARSAVSSWNSRSITPLQTLLLLNWIQGVRSIQNCSDSGFRLPCCLDWSCFV